MVFARERESSGGEIRAKEGLSHKRETSANENMTCLSSLISWSHHAPKSSLQLTENIRFSNSSLQLTENISFLVFVSSSELEIIASIQCLYTCFLYVYYIGNVLVKCIPVDIILTLSIYILMKALDFLWLWTAMFRTSLDYILQ